MDIGAAHAGGINSCDAWFLAARPGFELRIDEERAILEAEFRVWSFEMKRCGQAFMFERKNGFYERYGTGGDVEMSDVCFRRADRAKSLAIGRRTKRLGQSTDFDRIAKRRGCAVALNIGNGVGGHACQGLGEGGGLRLTIAARRRVADFPRTVVVDCAAAYDGADGIAIGQGGVETLQ